MTNRAASILAAVCALGLAGCATWDPAYHFAPRPAVVDLRAGDARVGRVEATVLGCREASGDEPATIHLRIRVQRDGETVVALPPGNLALIASGGRALWVHHAVAAHASTPPAGGAATFDVAFALPPPADLDDVDLERLELLADVDVGRERRFHRIVFERDMPNHSWWDPWGLGPP